MRLAYLLSQYPTVTHTFLLREVRMLRDSGLDIQVISIRGSDRPDHQLSPQEREERDRTYVVLDAGLAPLLGAHLGALLRRPFVYLGGAFYALRLAGLDLGKMFRNLMYSAKRCWWARRRSAWAPRTFIRTSARPWRCSRHAFSL